MNKFSNCKNLADYLNKIDDLREKRKSRDGFFSCIEKVYKKYGLDGILSFAKNKYSILQNIDKDICKSFLHEDFVDNSYIGIIEKLYNEVDCSFIEKVIDLISMDHDNGLISNDKYINDITKFTDIVNEQKK